MDMVFKNWSMEMHIWVNSLKASSKATVFTSGRTEAFIKDNSNAVRGKGLESGNLTTVMNSMENMPTISRTVGVNLHGQTDKSTRVSSGTIFDMGQVHTSIPVERWENLCGLMVR